jgi:hypothetical protein
MTAILALGVIALTAQAQPPAQTSRDCASSTARAALCQGEELLHQADAAASRSEAQRKALEAAAVFLQRAASPQPDTALRVTALTLLSRVYVTAIT